MSEPTTIKVVDKDGVVMWASRNAPFVHDGLADGSLREVPDAVLPAPSAHLDTHSTDDSTDGGSGDGERDSGDTGDGGDESVAGSTTSRGSRRRS